MKRLTLSMAIDKLLDIIIPLDLGLTSLKEKTRRLIMLLLSAAVLSVIVYTAVTSTLKLCPPDVPACFVCIMVAWRIFLHTIAYYALVVSVMAMRGTLKDKLKTRADESPKMHEPRPEPVEPENTFFYNNVDEEALVEYIKANPSRFISGEDMTIFYLIMTGFRGATRDMKKFHAFLAPLVDCKGYTQLVSSCARIRERLEYNNCDESRRRLIKKYNEMHEILKQFIDE